MSKDMLGPLVRACVKLDQSQVSVLLDTANRFQSEEDGSAWLSHQKKVLRAGIPKKEEQSLRLLDFEESNRLYAVEKSSLWWFNHDNRTLDMPRSFADLVLGPAQLQRQEELKPATLNAYRVKKVATCNAIQEVVASRSEYDLCVRLEELLRRQLRGDKGPLLTDGMRNLFNAGICVLSLRWLVQSERWQIDTVNDQVFSAGSRVFDIVSDL